MSDTPTPRTDAVLGLGDNLLTGMIRNQWRIPEWAVHAAFARQLERELNAARADADRLRGALGYLAKHCTCYETDWAGDYAKRALAEGEA